MTQEDAHDAEYGPGGYLPARAAQRARKIVLREQMGLHWPIAAIVAGVIILAITIPLVLSTQGPPGPPSVEVAPLSAVDPAGDALLTAGTTPVLLVRGGGVLRAFLDPPADARWCPASRRIESPAGQVWTAEGRLIAGDGDSLVRGAAQAYEGVVYVDPSSADSALLPLLGDAQPACHDGG